MSREKMDVILKGIVKHFFIEKEVTSTLVMDSLYSGLKALQGQAKNKKARPSLLDAKELPAPIVSVDKDMFVLVDDVLLLLERAALEPLPTHEDKSPQNRTKVGFTGCIYRFLLPEFPLSVIVSAFVLFVNLSFVLSISEDVLHCPLEKKITCIDFCVLGCKTRMPMMEKRSTMKSLSVMRDV